MCSQILRETTTVMKQTTTKRERRDLQHWLECHPSFNAKDLWVWVSKLILQPTRKLDAWSLMDNMLKFWKHQQHL
jgi:hypothetical protein